MKMRTILLFFSLLLTLQAGAQGRLTVIVQSGYSEEPLPGASVSFISIQLAKTTDTAGKAFFPKILEGRYDVKVSFTGYSEKIILVEIPVDTLAVVSLEPENMLEDATITATRTNARLEDAPMKVEVLG